MNFYVQLLRSHYRTLCLFTLDFAFREYVNELGKSEHIRIADMRVVHEELRALLV